MFSVWDCFGLEVHIFLGGALAKILLFWEARITTTPGLEKVNNCHRFNHSHFSSSFHRENYFLKRFLTHISVVLRL